MATSSTTSLNSRRRLFGIDVRPAEAVDGALPTTPINMLRLLTALFELSPQHRFLVFGSSYPWKSETARELTGRHNVSYRNYLPTSSRELDGLLIIDPPIKSYDKHTPSCEWIDVPTAILKTDPNNAVQPAVLLTDKMSLPLETAAGKEQEAAALILSTLASFCQSGKRVSAPVRRMKVVLQNRPNAFSAPGGDTVLMEHIYDQLLRHDVDASVSVAESDLTGVDLTHLINLTLPDVARDVAANALRHKVPYVITPLFEDWPRYLARATYTVHLFQQYLESGFRDEVFRTELAHLRGLPDGPRVGSDDVVNQAAALFATGESELRRLDEAYPGAGDRTLVLHLGTDEKWRRSPTSESKLVRELGAGRYVMCCGRLETRKNQLMLMKALEGTGLPLVLASGGFSFQPLYVELIRRYSERVPVKVLGRLPDQELINVMAHAAVHVLPSWFELPGLVTLEAAALGTPVVASDWGTIRDYLNEDQIELCEPDDPDSILAAITRAMAISTPNPAAARAREFTWDAFGDALYAAYERILSEQKRARSNLALQLHRSTSARTQGEDSMQPQTALAYRYDASIIIPTYNRARLLQECIEALSSCSDQSTYELLVVDNHSTDDTAQVLSALEGDVKVIRESENLGFAAACNHGARLADGEFLVFLNNDTLAHSGWLDALVKCARATSDVGAVGAKLLYPEGDVQHAGVAFNDRRIPYHICQHFPADAPVVNEWREMQAVTGACMLVPTRVFHDHGGFDEEYHNGFEDIDFCLRLKQAGRRVVYCPESVLTHREEASEGRKAHDRANLERFTRLWTAHVSPDEQEILARHGWQITWGTNGGRYERIGKESSMQPEGRASHPLVAGDTVAAARDLYESGRFEEAAALLQRLVESKVTLAGDQAFETWQILGNCLTRLNRTEEAENAFLEAIRRDQTSERPYLGLGSLAMVQQNWQAAMYGFMIALAKNPDALKGEFGVGVTMAARNMHHKAIEHFNRVLDHDPDNSEALFYLYRSAMEANDPQSAVAPLLRYLERHPNDADFLFNLCGAYWKMGDVPRAIQACRRVLDLNPGHPAANEVIKHLDAALPTYV